MVQLSSMVHQYTDALTQANQHFMRRNELTTFRRETESGHQLILVGLSIHLHIVENGQEVSKRQLRMTEAVETLVQGGGWERLSADQI